MNLQRISAQHVRKGAPTPSSAGTQAVDPSLGHPHLTQFVNELAAAPPDAERDSRPTPEHSPPRRHTGPST
jgi:hypothetical protein